MLIEPFRDLRTIENNPVRVERFTKGFIFKLLAFFEISIFSACIPVNYIHSSYIFLPCDFAFVIKEIHLQMLMEFHWEISSSRSSILFTYHHNINMSFPETFKLLCATNQAQNETN